MPIPAYINAFLITCGLQRRSVLNKTQMQANKLQVRSSGFEALPGYRRLPDTGQVAFALF
jgi:hypothetical protein